MRAGGLVEKLGVSVGNVQEAETVVATTPFDTVQLPFNAWDSSLLDSTTLKNAAAAGNTLHLRSVFLQGLLLMSPEDAARKLPRAARAAEKWSAIVEKHALDRRTAALAFAKTAGHPLVVGAETPRQLMENAETLEKASITNEIFREIRDAMADTLDESITNPAKWKTTT
jgi:aryl-alcohol dehydrogenase-like predicted oxidoreductase